MLEHGNKTRSERRDVEEIRRKRKPPEPVKLRVQTSEPNPFDAILESPTGESSKGGHATLFTDPRLSHPTNAGQKARMVSELQQHYGNAYVQRIVGQIQTRTGEEPAESSLFSSFSIHHLRGEFEYKHKKAGFFRTNLTIQLQAWLKAYQKKNRLTFNVVPLSVAIASSIDDCNGEYGLPERARINETYRYRIEASFAPLGIVPGQVPVNVSLISPSLAKKPPEMERGEKEEAGTSLTPEEMLETIEESDELLNKLDTWIKVAEIVTSGKTEEKVAGLRRELKRISGPLSTALDVKKKVLKSAKLILAIQRGLETEPGSEGGVRAAGQIFHALAELGQEIPILGGIVGSYLEFLKLPNVIINFGESVRELRRPEYRLRKQRERLRRM